jgi:stress response protein SCP2
MPNLSPGQNAPVPAANVFTISITGLAGSVDPLAMLLDEAHKAIHDEAVAFYGMPSIENGAVTVDGSTVTINTAAVPASVKTVLLVAQADGAPTVQNAGAVQTNIVADGALAAEIALDNLPAVATLQVGELYRHNGGWKARALGDGYAAGLAKLLSEHGISVEDDSASPGEAPVATPQAAPAEPAKPAISLEKQRIVDLQKRVEATGSVDMIKSFKSAAVNLEKQGLVGERAEVVLVLDVSGSSYNLFKNGAYQALVDRCLAAGLLFNDNGEIETYLFDSSVRSGETVTLANRDGWGQRASQTPGIWGGTSYAPPLQQIAAGVQRCAKTPTFVYFVTDGGNGDRNPTTKIVTEMAGKPIFLKFVAVGRESQFPFLQKLDDLKKREIDNADFFAVQDPKNIDEDKFFELVMQEFRGWLVEARQKGILGS